MLETYRTRQLPQAAYLVACGAKFLRVEPTAGRFCDLVFEDPDGRVEALAEGYYQGGTCSGLKFYRALTEIRIAIQQATGTLWNKGGNRG